MQRTGPHGRSQGVTRNPVLAYSVTGILLSCRSCLMRMTRKPYHSSSWIFFHRFEHPRWSNKFGGYVELGDVFCG